MTGIAMDCALERPICVLGADDDPVSRTLLRATLEARGHEVVLAASGAAAWEQIAALTEPSVSAPSGSPLLAILDWYMPEPDGVELCRRIRARAADRLIYVILLTSCTGHDAVVTGLGAGAHDFIAKPFNPAELHARVQVGLRVLRLQQALAERVRELEGALRQVRQLHGLLPICSYCKSIRRDDNYWQQLEHYISAHSDAQFSHGICPSCYHKLVEPQLEALRQKSAPADRAAPAIDTKAR